jgi:hypothetical protein
VSDAVRERERERERDLLVRRIQPCCSPRKREKKKKKKRRRSNGSWVPAMGFCGVISNIFLVFSGYPSII